CAEAGCSVIELDFNFTADRRLVCIHDWYHMYAEEIQTDIALTYDEFMNVKIYRNFTPLAIEDVIDFLREHDGVYIVTDIKSDNIGALSVISELCPDMLDRFIVQIYSADEYDAVRELGFEQIVYTLYRLTWNEKTDTEALAEFAESHKLVGYTFAAELCDVEGYVDGMKKTGVPLFVHTVDGEEEQQKYFDMGISGIYTNEVKK
ncbi:MAG: glycerophosphodiester phosphodiesterase family protein, partial [bacterium]|nr:glycerophosphodiester phosphodiesterase family protein [bacterium]